MDDIENWPEAAGWLRPYWRQHGVTVEDPEGWRVVLQATRGIGPGPSSS